MDVKQIDLERLYHESVRRISRDLIESARKPEIFIELTAREVVLSLKHWVWGQQQERDVVDYPKTWWDAFKLEVLFPRSAGKLRRRILSTVKMHHVTADAHAWFPDLDLVVPPQEHRLNLALREKITWYDTGKEVP